MDSRKFINAWRGLGVRSSEFVYPLGSHRWLDDRKMPDAIKGFAEGEKNPVPLAVVNITEAGNLFRAKRISFTNGITHTMWLLGNGADAFPVECSATEALALYSLAGVSGSPVITVDELVPLPVRPAPALDI